MLAWAGGEDAIGRMVNCFYDRVEGDEELAGLFPGGVTAEHRRFIAVMSVAADDAGLPDDPEFRSALLAYLEWGTRLAMHNAEPGAGVVAHAPVPRWGWGEAPPYQPS